MRWRSERNEQSRGEIGEREVRVEDRGREEEEEEGREMEEREVRGRAERQMSMIDKMSEIRGRGERGLR